ncbi:MAG TPA: phosphopantetheine-binding protein [Vicinamibacterales bacterium]|nr:phosphopantetheine-binding protein [Vicinamibacterales bacterium]
MPIPDDVFTRVRALIADSLALQESGITPQSRLIDDLGADSLDFVDLTFAIEKAFGVKLREAELNFLTRLDFSSPAVMQGGYLTRDTIASIRPLLPALDRAPDPDRVTPGELFSLLTVETLCLMVQRRLSI